MKMCFRVKDINIFILNIWLGDSMNQRTANIQQQQQQRGSADFPDVSLTRDVFRLLLEDPEPSSLRTDEICNPSREFWLNPGDSSTLDVPGKNNQTRDLFSVVIKLYTNRQRQTRTQIQYCPIKDNCC